MTRAPRLGPAAVLCATASGFLLAHAIVYVLVFRADRAQVLTRTGHAYLSTLGTGAWPLLGLAAALALVAGRRALTPARATALLVTAQSVFFVCAEAGERAAAHQPLTDLVRTPLLLVGLAAQVPVAVLLVALLGALAWLGSRFVFAPPRALPRLFAPPPRLAYVPSYDSALAPRRTPARAPPRA